MKTRTFVPTTARPIVKWTFERGALFSHYADGSRIRSDHTLKVILNLVDAGKAKEAPPTFYDVCQCGAEIDKAAGHCAYCFGPGTMAGDND